MKYIYRISPAILFWLGSSNLFLPAISKIWPAFGHWQPAISSPAIHFTPINSILYFFTLSNSRQFYLSRESVGSKHSWNIQKWLNVNLQNWIIFLHVDLLNAQLPAVVQSWISITLCILVYVFLHVSLFQNFRENSYRSRQAYVKFIKKQLGSLLRILG